MVELKMNKNQRRFFEMALRHFGSEPQMAKTLKAYADEKGIIFPSTILAKHCKVRRGWFDLSKSGVEVEVVPEAPTTPTLDNFNASPIVEVSSFADTPESKTPKQKKEAKAKQKKLIFRNPVYVVKNQNDGTIWAVADNFNQAYASVWKVLHDHGSIPQKEAMKRCEDYGGVVIKSVNAAIYCEITKHELNG